MKKNKTYSTNIIDSIKDKNIIESINKETKNNLKMKNIDFIKTKESLIKRINKALGKDNEQTNFTLGAIPSSVKSKIENDIGKKIFKDRQYILIINNDDIRHISKHFNSAKEIANELIRLFDIISNYDSIKFKKEKGENRLIFNKNYILVDIRCIETISNKNNSLNLVSIYSIKKRNQLTQPVTPKINGNSQLESISSSDNITSIC